MVYTLFFCSHCCFLMEKGKKPRVSLMKHVYGLKDILDQQLKCLQRSLIILMVFTCNIYRDKWFHIANELFSHI